MSEELQHLNEQQTERPEVADVLDEDIAPGFWDMLEEKRQFEDAWGAMDEPDGIPEGGLL